MSPDINSAYNYFGAFFNNAKQNSVLLIDPDGTIIGVNNAFINSFGYSENEILQQNFSTLFTDEDKKNEVPARELSNVIAKGQCSDNNFIVNKNKEVTWVSGESILVKNNQGESRIVKVIQNIHQEKISEYALKSSNDFNESILGSIEDVVVVIDDKMKIIKSNSAFAKLFDTPGVSSVNFEDLIKPHDLSNQLQKTLEKSLSLATGFSNQQIEIDTNRGDKRIFEISSYPMQKNLLVVMHDITINKSLEREREDIIGFVAHELRNPLANVVLCNEIMSDGIKSQNMDELQIILERSKNNVMRLNKMIAELYDATRINSGNLQLEITSFNFGEMVNEAIQTVEVLQPSYHVIVSGDGDIEISADRYRLIQVITNYLSNGIKYSNGKTDVTLTIKHDRKLLTVSVKDEGLGISKEQLPYIFERFFRAERTKNLEGIGLGLYLSRHIIRAHKGNVWAESEQGKGSTFYFSIPL